MFLIFNLLIIRAVHFNLQESLKTGRCSASRLHKMISMCEKIPLLSVALTFTVLYMRFMIDVSSIYGVGYQTVAVAA